MCLNKKFVIRLYILFVIIVLGGEIALFDHITNKRHEHFRDGSPYCFRCGQPATNVETPSYSFDQFTPRYTPDGRPLNTGWKYPMWLCENCKPPERLRIDRKVDLYKVEEALSFNRGPILHYIVFLTVFILTAFSLLVLAFMIDEIFSKKGIW